MKRREFVKAVGRSAGLAVGADLLGFYPPIRQSDDPSLLIPMAITLLGLIREIGGLAGHKSEK